CLPGSLKASPASCVPAPPQRRSRFMHPTRLNKLSQHAAEIRRVQEGDRSAHRTVPGPPIDQPHPAAADRLQGGNHVRDSVPERVTSPPPPRQETANRRVVSERLEQLHV